MTIDGVRCVQKKTYIVFYIDDFSDDIKSIIRDQLSSICHGPSKASKKRVMYNYRNTVISFLERYKKKSSNLRIGMIGELLAHVLIHQFLSDFNTVSPFFNMEEKSIKKGFDIVVYSRGKNELWITEVKSGELHEKKNSNETLKILLGKAKNDLITRLNENEQSLWDNAINGATVALDNETDIKNAVISILEEVDESVVNQSATSTDKNVILVSTLFADLKDEITEKNINDFYTNTINEKKFRDLLVLAIQKRTYEKVVAFLKEEAK
ncbi:hypothetical protein [Sporolactobacillus sp. KGMB 08714]|uniref:hypothetical protein n=1 Tax=Sporolactobacillus sp. KGMB 08714 TaxID=3064704 RepID=UPI002FBE4587